MTDIVIASAVRTPMSSTARSKTYRRWIGMVGRYLAGAYRLPFFPLRSYHGSDLPKVNPRIRSVDSPYASTGFSTSGDETVAVVPSLNPDVAIIHAQRADSEGNTHLWGLLGVQNDDRSSSADGGPASGVDLRERRLRRSSAARRSTALAT
jgi:hypothetical protein